MRIPDNNIIVDLKFGYKCLHYAPNGTESLVHVYVYNIVLFLRIYSKFILGIVVDQNYLQIIHAGIFSEIIYDLLNIYRLISCYQDKCNFSYSNPLHKK